MRQTPSFLQASPANCNSHPLSPESSKMVTWTRLFADVTFLFEDNKVEQNVSIPQTIWLVRWYLGRKHHLI